jgi:YhcH/YjgK/YiaL family protein
MIVDRIENTARYLAINQGFAPALAFLRRPDLQELPVGEYAIDGDRVYAMVSKAPGRKKELALLEIHERYIDVQLVLSGVDTMGWKSRSYCEKPAEAYDPQADIQFFEDQPDAWIPIHAGEFAIFFPEDAHMPLISSGEIHKVVVKIKGAPAQGNRIWDAPPSALPGPTF